MFPAVEHAWREYLGLSERESICRLAYIPEAVAKTRWNQIPKEDREKIVRGFRRATELGAICGWALLSDGQPACSNSPARK